MLFGNWKITTEAIQWAGGSLQRFVIPSNELNRTRQSGSTTLYHWILLATDEDWLTENDLYDLNYAFVFATAKFGLDFNYEIFDATLAQQYEQFEAEENEDAEG